MVKCSLSSYSTNSLKEGMGLKIQEHRKDNQRNKDLIFFAGNSFFATSVHSCTLRYHFEKPMESTLCWSIPSNYLHHTLESTQQRRKGFPSDDGRRENQRQLIFWLYDGITNKSKLNKVDVSHHFREYENAKCLFWGSVPTDVFSKTSLTKLLLLNSLYCRRRIGKNKKLLSNSGGFFQSHVSKETVTLSLTWKENRIGMVTNLFTLNHTLFSSQVFYSSLDDQNYASIHVNQTNPLLKWSSGETPSSLCHWKRPYREK